MIKIAAVMVVRNEADLLGANLRYHASQGISEFRIVDNGSSDRTPQLLQTMARELDVLWTRDEGPFHQSDMTTELAREAFHSGARWIVPLDADEFWSAGRLPLARVLERSDAGAIAADVVNFIQEGGSSREGPAALLTMTHRASRTPGDADQSWGLVEAGRIVRRDDLPEEIPVSIVGDPHDRRRRAQRRRRAGPVVLARSLSACRSDRGWSWRREPSMDASSSKQGSAASRLAESALASARAKDARRGMASQLGV
jgi:glycosyltransferase involved in cell wall biosynthesis